MAHAFLSPSGAPAWLRCHAKVWREQGLPDTSSEAADEGTAAHFLRDECLKNGQNTAFFLGQEIVIWGHPESDSEGAAWSGELDLTATERRAFQVDAEMARHVQKSIDQLRAIPGTLYPEQELDISFITGEEGATGTTDAAVLSGTELVIDDLKYGMGVAVDAVENEQLLIYGAAALEELDVLGEVETVRMRISQPRLDNDSEWVLPVTEVRQRIATIRQIADIIREGETADGRVLSATPGEKQCRFCKVKGSCEEYRTFVLNTVADDFVDLSKGEVAISTQDVERAIASTYGVKPKDVHIESPGPILFTVMKPSIKPQLEHAEERIANSDDQHLATCMDAVGMVEGWCKAVRAEVERRALAGAWTDGRYKLVEGKKGHRAWVDDAEAEKVLKSMRLKVDEMYDLKLISPTSAEKVLAASNPRKWKKLQDHIKQTQGKPSVAPASDKRPALKIAVEFENLNVIEAEVTEVPTAEVTDLAAVAIAQVMSQNAEDLI